VCVSQDLPFTICALGGGEPCMFALECATPDGDLSGGVALSLLVAGCGGTIGDPMTRRRWPSAEASTRHPALLEISRMFRRGSAGLQERAAAVIGRIAWPGAPT
jgi:hypothetical protein